MAEVGVGVAHCDVPPPARPLDPAVAALHRRIKAQFDPDGRLAPGRRPLGSALTPTPMPTPTPTPTPTPEPGPPGLPAPPQAAL